MQKQLILFIYFLLIAMSCKQKEVAPPTLTVSNSTIDLGTITTTSSSSFMLVQSGEGSISYTISSNKNWLKLSKNSGVITGTDFINLSTIINAVDIQDGENTAVLSITPTINGVVSPVINVTVKGTFKTTTIEFGITNLDLQTIRAGKSVFLKMTKVGVENLNYEVTVDQPWLSVDKSVGTLSGTDSVKVNIDTKSLINGNYSGNITIIPKVNGISGKQTTIPVKFIYDDSISGNIESHILNKNETWSGEINLNGTVSVPKEFVLTIKPGTKIKVKSTIQGVELVINGKLIMNGDAANIIEMKSENKSPEYDDWNGIVANGDIEISYCYLRDAGTPISFYSSGLLIKPSKAPIIHHILFENAATGIEFLASKYETTLYNLTFRNLIFDAIITSDIKKLNLKDIEFISEEGDDITLYSSGLNLSITNSNFVNKSQSFYYNAFVYDNGKYTDNTVIFTNCFGVSSSSPAFAKFNNVFTNSSPAQISNQNIGCGFSNKYKSAQLRMNILAKKKIYQQFIEYKNKQFAKQNK